MSSLPFRIAVITTEYRADAHADVIVSRWLRPRPTDGQFGWGPPRTSIASIYTMQKPANDMADELCAEYGIPRFATVEEALTLGGDSLAVDAVLLIAEHGEFPLNEFQQKLYPRKELFDEVVAVFRRCGRVVPIFFDKHFSWNPASVREMYATVREMKIPFFGGSSLPFSPIRPALDAPRPGGRMEEMVALYFDSLEAYLFHSLELAEMVLEHTCEGYSARRSGVASVIAWKGQGVWEALDDGAFSETLFLQAASNGGEATLESVRRVRETRDAGVHAFQLHYRNGTKITHLMHRDWLRQWALAWRLEDGSGGSGYPETGGREVFFAHFARLNRVVEDFFLSGCPPIALERLYVTSMMTAFCMQALAHPGERFEVEAAALPVGY